jgi:hypothetical protein
MANEHTTAPTAEQLKAQQEAARAQREAAQKTATEAVDARTALSQKRTADYYEKAAAAKPTPTPKEIDLAIMGVHTDEHEDDGSGPQLVPVTIMVPQQEVEGVATPQSRAAAGGEPGKYKTRDVKP